MSYMDNREKQSEIKNKADMIWSIADKLRGQYKAHEYGLVILPFTVLRRFDCALAGRREEIRRVYQLVKDSKENVIAARLEDASGLKYYDTNLKGLRSVLDNPKDVAGSLRTFIGNFSQNVKDVLQEFNIFEQIERLEKSGNEGGLLFTIIDEITSEKNDLSPDVVSDIEMGYIFEEIIRRFSESYNEDAGQHYTPRDAIDLMVEILIREEDKGSSKVIARRILDPACGTGGMLSEAREYMNACNPKVSLHCHGQEYNPETFAICTANSLIKDATFDNISDIKKGDTLSDFKFKGKKFNYIISNPPFGGEWKVEERAVRAEAADPDGRFSHGLPGISDSQMLFLSTAVSAMESPFEGEHTGSRVAIIHNGSPLFTGDAGSGPSEIRRHILENDLLDAIISLPENIFYNTGIGTYIWVLDNNKPAHRKGRVQLIDGSRMFDARRKSVGNKRVDIDPHSISVIAEAYRGFEDATYGEGAKTCESKVLHASEFGYIKAGIAVPMLDADGRVMRNARGATVYDRSKNDHETIPLGIMELRPGRDYLGDPAVKKMIEDHMDREIRPYSKFAEVDEGKMKVGFEIPFTRYFYKYSPPRPSDEIREELRIGFERMGDLAKRLFRGDRDGGGHVHRCGADCDGTRGLRGENEGLGDSVDRNDTS